MARKNITPEKKLEYELLHYTHVIDVTCIILEIIMSSRFTVMWIWYLIISFVLLQKSIWGSGLFVRSV